MRRAATIFLSLVMMSACGPAVTNTPTVTPTLSREEATATGHAINVATMDAVTTKQANRQTPTEPSPESGPTSTSAPSDNPILVTTFPVPSSDTAPIPQGARTRLGLGSIRASAMSHRGEYFGVGTTAGLYVYRSTDFKQVWKHFIRGPVYALVWSPDDAKIAVLIEDDPAALIFEADTGREIARFEQTGGVSAVAWSQDGTRLVTAWGRYSGPGKLTIWDLETLAPQKTIAPDNDVAFRISGPILTLAWMSDDRTIAGATAVRHGAGAWKEALLLWDIATGERSGTGVLDFGTVQGELQYVRPSPDKRWIAGYTGISGGDAPAGQPAVYVWDSQTMTLVHSLKTDGFAVYSAEWSPDGKHLASGSGSIAGAGSVAIWDAITGEAVHTLIGHPATVNGLAWSPDGVTLLSGGGNYENGGTVIGWDVAEGSQRFAISGWPMWIDRVDWLLDGKSFVITSPDRIQRFGATSPILANSLIASYGIGGVDSVSWSPDGTRLAASIGGFEHFSSVVVWDAQTLSPLYTLDAPQARLEWSADGAILATRTEHPDGYPVYRYWDVTDGTPLDMAGGDPIGDDAYTGAPQTSPDGLLEIRPLPPCCQKTERITVLDMASQQPIAELDTFPSSVMSMAWSPDGKYVAGGGGIIPGHGSPWVEGWEENTVMVWDTSDWHLVHTFLGHTGSVNSLSWSPDSHFLASGSADGTVIIWDVAP